jgi:hypothetical protein
MRHILNFITVQEMTGHLRVPAALPLEKELHWAGLTCRFVTRINQEDRGVLPLEVKRLGSEADHSPPFVADIKNA